MSESSSRRRPLPPDECLALLRAVAWGTLAVADGAQPIAVPVTYALAGERLFLTMTDGRKRRALDANPRLALTVADVRSLGAWRSVQAIGRLRWLEEDAERALAARAFTDASRPEGFRLRDADVAHLRASLLGEVVVEQLIGFASNMGPGA